MEKITHQEFRQETGRATIILTLTIFYSLYKLFIVADKTEYIVIIVCCAICFWAIFRLLHIGERMMADSTYSLKPMDRLIMGNIIIGLLSVLSFYIFFVKGIYGLYKLVNDFVWLTLLLRVIVIILYYYLIKAVASLQSVFKSLRNNTITRDNVVE